MTDPPIVLDYDPNWPVVFESLRNRIAGALGETAAAIEHVGSTAIPNLAAKPIIDIDVLLTSEDMLPVAIERLASLGYTYQGNLGVPGREAFLAPAGGPPHHLYVCPPRSAEFRRHLAFRNYLRAHPADAIIYADLKMALTGQFREDRTTHVIVKTELIEALTGQAVGASEE